MVRPYRWLVHIRFVISRCPGIDVKIDWWIDVSISSEFLLIDHALRIYLFVGLSFTSYSRSWSMCRKAYKQVKCRNSICDTGGLYLVFYIILRCEPLSSSHAETVHNQLIQCAEPKAPLLRVGCVTWAKKRQWIMHLRSLFVCVAPNPLIFYYTLHSTIPSQNKDMRKQW